MADTMPTDNEDTTAPFLSMRSHIPGIAWPPMIGGEAAAILTLIYQLEDMQWFPASRLKTAQFSQLAPLVAHCAAYSPLFRDRLAKAGLSAEQASQPTGFHRLPVMKRAELQAAGDSLFCTGLPQAHAPTGRISTSGSTGRPVSVLRTALTQQFWMAHAMRDHLWHNRDFTGILASIKPASGGPPGGAAESFSDWGSPAGLYFETGPCHVMPAATPASDQARWLAAINPTYLTIYPSNLDALLDEVEARNIRLPGLRQVRTMAETLSPRLRARAQKTLGAPIADHYSCDEIGTIALQCPRGGLYHTMDESLIVEVLDEADQPCQPGVVGRIVITDLHNFATPLIRYDIGDHAEAGAACPCGRGLGTLARIMGRTRNMLVTAEGKRWLTIDFHRHRDAVPFHQYQLLQTAIDRVEIRLVVPKALLREQEDLLKTVLLESLGPSFHVDIIYVDSFAKPEAGKFEEFICAIR